VHLLQQGLLSVSTPAYVSDNFKHFAVGNDCEISGSLTQNVACSLKTWNTLCPTTYLSLSVLGPLIWNLARSPHQPAPMYPAIGWCFINQTVRSTTRSLSGLISQTVQRPRCQCCGSTNTWFRFWRQFDGYVLSK
jgi:hypothetical protein